MATPKEQIAQHTYAEATQHQQVADDPLAPAPIRFTHRRDAEASDAARMLTISIQHRPAPHAAPCATSKRCHSSTGGRWCCPLPRNSCAANVSPERHVLPESKDAAGCGHSTW